jgi:hypothetical protein
MASLYTHKRVHTGKSLFRCGTCFKTFTVRGSLHTHENIHKLRWEIFPTKKKIFKKKKMGGGVFKKKEQYEGGV